MMTIGLSKTLFFYISLNRREHLSAEDIQKNKAIMENISKGTWDNSVDGTNGVRITNYNFVPQHILTCIYFPQISGNKHSQIVYITEIIFHSNAVNYQ